MLFVENERETSKLNPFSFYMTYWVRHVFITLCAHMTYWVRQENEGTPNTKAASIFGPKDPLGAW